MLLLHSTGFKWDKLDKKSEPEIFIGNSSTSKAYRIYQPQSEKIIVSRDLVFMEDEQWDWNARGADHHYNGLLPGEDDVDEQPVRGTRLLTDIYARCNVAVMEPASVQEAMQKQKCIAAIQEEVHMIEKNLTWQLIERPSNRKVIRVKWVFRTKLNADGSMNKHKARLVVKGYAQVFGWIFQTPLHLWPDLTPSDCSLQWQLKKVRRCSNLMLSLLS